MAECETHPSMPRFNAKNYSSLWFQPSVLCDGEIRRILAIPRGRLDSVDLRIRSQWEVWILGATRSMEKFGLLGRSRPANEPVPLSGAIGPSPPLARDSDLLTTRAGTNLR